jgi:site-specific DNA-methyltransferase (adenine-specific)
MELYNTDCLGENGLCKILDKSIDMILCDLPYGTTANKWDCVLPLDEVFKEYNRIIKDNGAIVLFGSQPFTTDLINANKKYFKYELVWQKNYGSNFLNANKMPLKTQENILVFYKNQPVYYPQKTEGKPYKITQRQGFISHIGAVKDVKKEDSGKIINTRHPKSVLNFKNDKGKHTTLKPVALCEWLIKTYTNEGDLVLDNTMGSGTTGVSCKKTNRRFIGFELDETYFNIAKERIDGCEVCV